ncbi:YbdD/YjiX family protein [Streptomyces europaeiscabiei]|nr:YbdD/YjiX family protein [Streptomyces europaeiscabiei]MDX3691281.1 YbdD/YjiX family protein [Streptomyces europaeiscabiei]
MRAARGARRYVRELIGESAYDRCVDICAPIAPDAPVPSRREFERMRTDRQEADLHQRFHCR